MNPVNLSSLDHDACARLWNQQMIVVRAGDLQDLAFKIESFLQIPTLDANLLTLANGMRRTGSYESKYELIRRSFGDPRR